MLILFSMYTEWNKGTPADTVNASTQLHKRLPYIAI